MFGAKLALCVTVCTLSIANSMKIFAQFPCVIFVAETK